MKENSAASRQRLNIGALELRLDDAGAGVRIKFPPIYAPFQLSSTQRDVKKPFLDNPQMPKVTSSLVLHLKEQPVPASFEGEHLVHHNVLWGLHRNSNGNYIFRRSREPNGYCLVVDSAFVRGQIIGEHLAAQADSQYLFTSLDLPLFANWLGTYGDLILHASCVVVNGRGYCFVGHSGAGKSTLAAHLAAQHALTVLGDDHIILRCLDGQFWVFGSPWHQNPTLCVPLGVPLERLIVLDRDGIQGMNAISPLDGVSRILQTAFIPYYRPELTGRILVHLSQLAEKVPFFSLSYPLGSDPIDLILGDFS